MVSGSQSTRLRASASSGTNSRSSRREVSTTGMGLSVARRRRGPSSLRLASCAFQNNRQKHYHDQGHDRNHLEGGVEEQLTLVPESHENLYLKSRNEEEHQEKQ